MVEADARILLARHKDSGYFETLVADTFAEQGAFIQAADAYKKALAFPDISCRHACSLWLRPAESA